LFNRPKRQPSDKALVQPLERRTFLSLGELDSLYGSGGISSFFGNMGRQELDIVANQVIALPDGRAYVGGEYGWDLRLGRLDFDGNPDPTFGTGGSVTTDVLGGTAEEVQSMVVQLDEKIVVLSDANPPGGYQQFALLRYDKFGVLDPTFGNNGLVTTHLGYNGANTSKLLLQPDGKLIAAGEVSNGNRSLAAIVRYLPNGLIDPDFATGGKFVADLLGGTSGGEIRSGLVLPDGKLLFVGISGGYNASRIVLLRLLPNGTPDPTFGANGVQQLLTAPFPWSSEMIPAPGGGFFIVGDYQDKFGLVRVTDAGELDTSWGSGGSVTLYVDGNAHIGTGGAVAVQSDGSLIVSHEHWYGWYVARVLANGQQDAAFGTGGVVNQNLGSYGEGGRSLALQPDGRVLVAGGNSTYPTPIPGGLIAARYRTMADVYSAASLDAGSGAVSVTGTLLADTVTVTRDAGAAEVRIAINGVEHAFAAAAVKRVDVRTFDGNDVITVEPGAPLGAIDAGAGDDTITLTRVAGNRRVVGGTGNDNVTLTADAGSGGAVSFEGGDGNADTLSIFGSAADDVLQLGYATPLIAFGHTITYDAFVENLTIDAGGGVDAITVAGSSRARMTVTGGNGNDAFELLDTAKGESGFTIGKVVALSGGDGADTLHFAGHSFSESIFAGARIAQGGTGDVAIISLIEDVTVDGLAGNDTLTADAGATATVHLNGGTGTNQFGFAGSAADDTIHATATGLTWSTAGGASGTVTTTEVEAISIRGAGGNDTVSLSAGAAGIPVTVLGEAGNDTLNVNSAPWGALSFQGGTNASSFDTLSVNAGTFTFASDARLTTLNLTVNVATGAAAVFNSTQRLAGLNVAGGVTTLSSGGNRVLVTRGLSVTAGGVLDLTNNDLALDYDPTVASPIGSFNGSSYTGVIGLIAAGATGAGGSRIVSSLAADGFTTLGIAEAFDVIDFGAAQTKLWGGQAVDKTAVLIKYTYGGDANLDGIISGDDYAAIDFNIAVPNSSGWYNGDFNYDGIISGDDYTVIDFNIAAQGPPLAATQSVAIESSEDGQEFIASNGVRSPSFSHGTAVFNDAARTDEEPARVADDVLA
jgi:uncharacterized delta-60 repeat protein